MELVKRFVDKHQVWLDPVLTVLIGLSSAFLTYNLPIGMANQHPIRAWFLETFVNFAPWLLPISLLTYAALKITEGLNRKPLSILQEELEKEQKKNGIISDDVKNLFDGYLFHFSTKLGFGTQSKNNERVTLYVHDPKNNKFIPFGRYSHDPEYRKPGRSQYPDSQGCISKAWRNGWHFDDAIGDSPDQRATHHQTQYQIPKQASSKFKMPSKLYAACRIENESGEFFAVMVVESTVKDRYQEAFLKTEMEQQRVFLSELIERLSAYIPFPASARERGF